MYKLLGSSQSPESISLTFKGVALGLVPVLIVVLKMAGVSVLESDFVSLVENTATTIASVMVIYGLARKMWNGRWSA